MFFFKVIPNVGWRSPLVTNHWRNFGSRFHSLTPSPKKVDVSRIGLAWQGCLIFSRFWWKNSKGLNGHDISIQLIHVGQKTSSFLRRQCGRHCRFDGVKKRTKRNVWVKEMIKMCWLVVFNPPETYGSKVKLDIFPNFRGENKKYGISPPPRSVLDDMEVLDLSVFAVKKGSG